jgi:hypothetical protein
MRSSSYSNRSKKNDTAHRNTKTATTNRPSPKGKRLGDHGGQWCITGGEHSDDESDR